MPAATPRIAFQLVEPLVDWLAEHGHDAAALLRQAGLKPPGKSDPARMVPLRAYVDLLERAAAATGQPHLGLRLAQFDEPGTVGALGYLFMSATSLLDAFEGFCGHLDALQEGTSNRLMIAGDTVTIQYRIEDSRITHRRQDSEYSVAAMHTLARLFTGSRVRPREVHFEHRQAGRYSIYRDLFQCEVFFEQPFNALVYRRESFNIRFAHRSHLLQPIIKSHLSALSRQRTGSRSFGARVAELIERGLAGSSSPQRSVADALGISVSTLIRRLKQENLRFRSLLSDSRLQLAERLIRLDDRPISAIALAAGYAENASFTRAFRRRFGQSPEELRRSVRRRRVSRRMP